MDTVELQLKISNEFVRIDLDQSASFPFNLKAADLTNPTAVKNTYSNQISIPKTRHNDTVFSHIWMFDSQILNFNPLIKTSFRLYVNNDLFQAGYIKLEEIDSANYKIRLFGGIGDFFNYLAKISLKDLPIDCTHTVNAPDVSKLMTNDNGKFGYALTYQGKYDKFDDSLTDNGKGLDPATWTKGITYANPDLDENKRTERDYAGEYRSYYQKPTIKLRVLLDEIIEKAKANGFNVELDNKFFVSKNPYYNDLWLLSNNYEVGDISGGNSFCLKEFGDTGTDRPNSVLKIDVKSECFDIDGIKILPVRFKSTSDRNSISCGVIISDTIRLTPGQKIEVTLLLKVIATFYDNSKDDQRVRHKYTSLTTALEILNSESRTDLSDNKKAAAASKHNASVARRIFDDNNVQSKRPTNRGSDWGFGEQNFAYDHQVNDTSKIIDNNTEWLYTQTYTNNTNQDVNIKVRFNVTGNTYWKANRNKTRQYGVAFRILDGSKIQVTGGENSDGTRSGTEKYYRDIIGDKYTCFDLLLSYCKLFGLFFKIDNKEDKLSILLRDNFYTGEILDWSEKIDKSRGVKQEPLAFNYQSGVFKYNELKTKYEEKYQNINRSDSDDEMDYREYGAKIVNTGYEIQTDTFNYLDGTIFDNCIIASDKSLYYAERGSGLTDNKELPHLEDSSGKRVELNGYVLLFRDGTYNTSRAFRITDDTDLMQANGTICWNNSNGETLFTAPKYVRTVVRPNSNGMNEVYSLNFVNPIEKYSKSEELQTTNSGIYSRYWSGYLNDRLDPNSKILTCYVSLDTNDIQDDILRKFVYIKNSLWAIDEIIGFNPLSNTPTKVKLVKIKDINNYLDHSYLSDRFKIYHNGSLIFDNSSGISPERIILNENDTSILLEIESTTNWTATSGQNLSRTSGNEENLTVEVTIPTNIDTVDVRFTYGNNNVTVQIVRQRWVTVTATTENGSEATINGSPSPLQIVVNKTATFDAKGENDFLYWIINNQYYYLQTVSLIITEPTTAKAYFLASGQIKLYCDDEDTTIIGETKADDYWVLTHGLPYTFTNSREDFSGFIFEGDTFYSNAGTRTILPTDNYLSVFYNKALINITVINESPDHIFSGDYIYLDDDKELDFECDPGDTIQINISSDVDTKITFDRYDYHYPTFSIGEFEEAGIYDLTITGHRVGWDGDAEIEVETPGFIELERKVYGPVDWQLVSDLEIVPIAGNSDEDIRITLLGQGGKVTQKIGNFEYALNIIQNGTSEIGWTDEKLISYSVDADYDETNVSVKFFHDNFPLVLSDGLSQGADTPEADGSVWSEITATFEANPYPAARVLTFTITANNTEYSLHINQDATAFGWTDDKLPSYTVNVTAVDTETRVKFYHNGATVNLGAGLVQGADNTEPDGTIWSDITATFPENPYPVPRTLTFTISIEETVFTLYIVQDIPIPVEDNYWGQRPDENGVVTGNLTGADGLAPSESCIYNIGSNTLMYKNGYFCGDLKANTFTGSLSNPLTFTGNSTGTYNGGSPLEINIPTKLPNPNELKIMHDGSELGTYDGSNTVTIDLPSSGFEPSDSCTTDIGSPSKQFKDGYFCNNINAGKITLNGIGGEAIILNSGWIGSTKLSTVFYSFSVTLNNYSTIVLAGTPLSNITLKLPSDPQQGQIHWIKHVDLGRSIGIDGNGRKIVGSRSPETSLTSTTLSNGDSFLFVYYKELSIGGFLAGEHWYFSKMGT